MIYEFWQNVAIRRPLILLPRRWRKDFHFVAIARRNTVCNWKSDVGQCFAEDVCVSAGSQIVNSCLFGSFVAVILDVTKR